LKLESETLIIFMSFSSRFIFLTRSQIILGVIIYTINKITNYFRRDHIHNQYNDTTQQQQQCFIHNVWVLIN